MSKYFHGHHSSVLRSHEWRTVDNSCPHLIPYLGNPSLRVLDVGCGPGTITVDLASRIPQGTVIAFDPSAEVIEKAKKHAEEKGITNVKFEVGDIYDSGYEPGSFDIVHAHQVLQHIRDPVGAMKAMKKLTKPGGIVAVRDADYVAFTWYPEVPGLKEWQDIYVKVARGLGADPSIGRRLHAVAMEAGFARSAIDASVANWTYSTPEERSFWCGLWQDRAVHSDFKKNTLESGHGTEDDIKKIVQAFKELEEHEYGWFTVPNGQIICRVPA